MLRLYDYFRSSAAYRVRIALNLKGLDYEHVGVHLVKDGGRHLAPDYARLNPQRLVPALDDDDLFLTQSLAILEYLEEVRPKPPLLPEDPPGRARVRALALAVACEIHPLNNLRVLKYLTGPLGLDEAAKTTWYRHWITEGFAAIEVRLAREPSTGRFCHGDRPGLADACLVPQVFNARRFEVDLTPYPTIRRIDQACQALPAFERAHPENQPDAG